MKSPPLNRSEQIQTNVDPRKPHPDRAGPANRVAHAITRREFLKAGLGSWDEAIPRPILQSDADGKKFITWTNTAAGTPASILEQNSLLQKTGWVRRTPQTPRRYEFDLPQGTNGFFRLRKPY